MRVFKLKYSQNPLKGLKHWYCRTCGKSLMTSKIPSDETCFDCIQERRLKKQFKERLDKQGTPGQAALMSKETG